MEKTQMIEYINNVFAIIGIAFVVYYFIIPLSKCTMFALGFTLFTWWKWNIDKVLKHPLLAIKASVKCFLDGVVMFCDYGNTQHITSGKKRWTPYFKYERLD